MNFLYNSMIISGLIITLLKAIAPIAILVALIIWLIKRNRKNGQ